MDKSLFCVSWLNGHVKAAAVERGSIVASWERPVMVADFSGFNTVLSEALENTRRGAKQMVMVVAHPRHIQEVLEVPGVKGGMLAKFLRRRVLVLKTFEGEASWAWQTALPTKRHKSVLLHIFPKPLVDQLTGAGAELGLQLVRLLPTTAVLAEQLKKISFPKDELALVAAETGSTTTVVIGTSDGRICLGRMLRGRWNKQIENLVVDLTRTIGFAEQQAGMAVGSVWLFGADAPEHVMPLQSALRLPTQVSPVEYTPFYWAEQAAKLPEKDDGNLISVEFRAAPQRRRLLTVTSIILLALLVTALLGSAFIEGLRRNWLRTIEREKLETVRLQNIRLDWIKRNHELDRKREFIRVVVNEKLSPVPAWFLGYLSEAFPKQLLLTELRVARTNDGWWVKMAGVAQPTTNSAPFAVFRQAATTITNQLTEGPFHMSISRLGLLTSDRVEKTAIAANTPKSATNTFVIEGMIR